MEVFIGTFAFIYPLTFNRLFNYSPNMFLKTHCERGMALGMNEIDTVLLMELIILSGLSSGRHEYSIGKRVNEADLVFPKGSSNLTDPKHQKE